MRYFCYSLSSNSDFQRLADVNTQLFYQYPGIEESLVLLLKEVFYHSVSQAFRRRFSLPPRQIRNGRDIMIRI
ncbi:hypothetical protein ABKN59_003356 [Abortiporus biennis]